MQARHPKSTLRRAIEFGIVGIVVSVLSFVQLWLYIDLLYIPYWVAYVIQTVVSIELNYWGNYCFAWSDRRKTIKLGKSHMTFWGTRIVMVAINFILFAAATALGMNYLLVQTLIVGSNTILNYFIGDKLVFKSTATPTTKETTDVEKPVC